MLQTNPPEGLISLRHAVWTTSTSAEATRRLSDAVLAASGHRPEIHIEKGGYQILQVDGTLSPASDVHVTMSWWQRSAKAKARVAGAVQAFFDSMGFGMVDLTFLEATEEGSYYLGREAVPRPDCLTG